MKVGSLAKQNKFSSIFSLWEIKTRIKIRIKIFMYRGGSQHVSLFSLQLHEYLHWWYSHITKKHDKQLAPLYTQKRSTLKKNKTNARVLFVTKKMIAYSCLELWSMKCSTTRLEILRLNNCLIKQICRIPNRLLSSLINV